MNYVIVTYHKFGEIFAFDIDGYGNYLMMDDTNSIALYGFNL
ncbi:glycoside hydrolase family 125 protein [Flavivirga sp. 57AJ16]|nr:glycoside hydrolase family 125 protein [Flavivirga sp. 57AJ16]MDD7885130.1 glycoside hydrolase family 125 protein [Flavivirga sp. 57AJ16]